MEIDRENKNNCQTIKFRAMEDGAEIGHGYLYIINNDAEGERYGLLADVKVKKNYRGQGIGTNLVKKIIDEAKKKKCLWLLATSRYSRPHVHEWYKKIGFEDYGKEFKMEF